MIKSINQIGEGTDRINKLFVNKFLKELDEEDKDYHIGIDWGSKDGDITAIGYYTIDKNFKVKFEGFKYISQFEGNTTKI